jgi:hypothetical protein
MEMAGEDTRSLAGSAAHGFCGLWPAPAPPTISKAQNAKLQGLLAYRNHRGVEMSQKSGTPNLSSERIVKDIRRKYKQIIPPSWVGQFPSNVVQAAARGAGAG